MAGNARFIEHKNKRILLIDFSRCELEEIVSIIREAKKLISMEPPASVLTLTNVTGTHNNAAVVRVMKDFTTFNRPYVKAAAVVGIEGLTKIVFDAILKFSGRTLVAHEDVDKAKDWLVEQ